MRLPIEVDFQRARILDFARRQGKGEGRRSAAEVGAAGAGAPGPLPAFAAGHARTAAALVPIRSCGGEGRTDVRSHPAHEIGDRVWACGLDLYWYPGIVLGESDDNWKVLFDFGGHALIPFEQTVPLSYDVGDRIWSRWQAGNEFFAGTITRKEGEIIEIHYDDDDTETTSIRLARLERDDWLPAAQVYELGPGDRVLGCWFDRFWYPGIILSMEGKRIHVLFDDNDNAYLTWDRVRPLEIEVGDRILCRLKGGKFYLPGEVLRKKDERIFVKYDDGQEEWTSVRLLRLEKLSN